MGFKTGATCTVFDVKPYSDKVTRLRVSVSKKKPGTEPAEYIQDFGGYVSVLGKEAAKQAAKLRVNDRIVLDDIDVSVVYDKEKGKEFTDFKVFGFSKAEPRQNTKPKALSSTMEDPQTEEGDGYPF